VRATYVLPKDRDGEKLIQTLSLFVFNHSVADRHYELGGPVFVLIAAYIARNRLPRAFSDIESLSSPSTPQRMCSGLPFSNGGVA
jgi:hypothetical protein